MSKTNRLTYTISHEAWYWDTVPRDNNETAEITVHREALSSGGSHDGVHWEFTISWRDLGGVGPCPKVGVFDDAFAAFTEIPEFFAGLEKLTSPIMPEHVVALLDSLDFTDVTERERAGAR